jgi:hypothetical protein
LTEAERYRATELPGTRAAREAAEAAQAARQPDVVRARYEAALAAQRARGEEAKRWVDLRTQVTRLAEQAETQRFHAFEAMDIEAALAADARARSLRALVAPLTDHIKRKFPAGINLAVAERV